MPTPEEIRTKLAELLDRIASIPADSVRDTANLKDLGIDSVATVELAEGVGTAFDVRLTDESVNEWRTVGDVVRTVQRGSIASAAAAEEPDFDPERIGAFKQLAIVLAMVGAGVGVLIGVAVAVFLASALPSGGLPPMGAPVAPMPAASETSRPADAGAQQQAAQPTAAVPTPALTATPADVTAGARFHLSGRLPKAQPGESLKIEWRESGGSWAPFPIKVTARDDGSFESQVYISSPGEREFRVRSDGTGGSTPPTLVRIS